MWRRRQKSAKSDVEVDGNQLDADQHYNTYMSADPTTLDSVKGNDTYGWSVLLNIMEPLTRMDEQDGETVRVPAGAKSWESNDDGTVWTFTLNDNKWSDRGLCIRYQADFGSGIRLFELVSDYLY